MAEQMVCSRCVLDTTISSIRFDEKGVCNFCKLHEKLEKEYPLGKGGEEKIKKYVKDSKTKGDNRKYDCVVGVSGGTDSTYCLYLVKKWGLRPLAVHLDNGWNSEIAEENIKRITEKLGVDLKVVKVDLKEFRDLQIAFLKASVSDAEIPSDVGVYATLFKVASDEGIPYVINGHSFRTEGTAPIDWTYMDGRYIEDVYRRFGKGKKLKHFTNLKILNLLSYILIKRIKEFRPLEYMPYNKVEAGKILEKELEWQYYGGHHYESIYTRFLISYILPTKFNIDKRKVSLSAKVRSGQITRDGALAKLKEALYPPEKVSEDREHILETLGLSDKEFEELMALPPKTFRDYNTYVSYIRALRLPIKVACKLHLLPEIFYEKYAK